MHSYGDVQQVAFRLKNYKNHKMLSACSEPTSTFYHSARLKLIYPYATARTSTRIKNINKEYQKNKTNTGELSLEQLRLRTSIHVVRLILVAT